MSHRTLYEITGDIKDVNTLLIPRAYFGEIQMQMRYNLWCPYKGSPDPWLVWQAAEEYIKEAK